MRIYPGSPYDNDMLYRWNGDGQPIYQGDDIAPHAETTRISQGFGGIGAKGLILGFYGTAICTEAPTTPDIQRMAFGIDPDGSGFEFPYWVQQYRFTAVGDRAEIMIPGPIPWETGGSVYAFTEDLATGGTITYRMVIPYIVGP